MTMPSSTDLTPRDAVDVAAIALEYARKVEAGTATSIDISTMVCHLVTLNEDLPGLLGLPPSTLAEEPESVGTYTVHDAVVAFLRLTPTTRVHIMQEDFGMTEATYETDTQAMMHHLRDRHLVSPFIEFMANRNG